jgi:hypothetical protein
MRLRTTCFYRIHSTSMLSTSKMWSITVFFFLFFTIGNDALDNLFGMMPDAGYRCYQWHHTYCTARQQIRYVTNKTCKSLICGFLYINAGTSNILKKCLKKKNFIGLVCLTTRNLYFQKNYCVILLSRRFEIWLIQ